jgi:hypothetical protein
VVREGITCVEELGTNAKLRFENVKVSYQQHDRWKDTAGLGMPLSGYEHSTEPSSSM